MMQQSRIFRPGNWIEASAQWPDCHFAPFINSLDGNIDDWQAFGSCLPDKAGWIIGGIIDLANGIASPVQVDHDRQLCACNGLGRTVNPDGKAVFGYLRDIAEKTDETGCRIAGLLGTGGADGCSAHDASGRIAVGFWFLETICTSCVLCKPDAEKGLDTGALCADIGDVAIDHRRSGSDGVQGEQDTG